MRKTMFTTVATLLVTTVMAGGFAAASDQSQNAQDQSQISKDKARTIATDKYGGDIINVEKDKDDGQLNYEVELKNSKQGRMEVHVNATNGKIVDTEKEDRDDDGDDDEDRDDGDQNQSNQEANISKDEAAKAATDKYNGDVINVEKENDDGSLNYEVELKNSKQGRMEVNVNAMNGKIIDTEKEDQDNDDDDDDDNDRDDD